MSLAITISFGNGRELRCGPAAIGVVAMALAAVLWFNAWQAPAAVVQLPEANTASAEVAALREAINSQMTQLAARVGAVQAKAQRLEALGQEMANRYASGDVEFSVAAEPALGGPAQMPARLEGSDDLLSLMEQLELVGRQLDQGGDQLVALDSVLRGEEVANATGVAGKPVRSGYISSYFGVRADPFNGRATRHLGIDFAGRPGSAVVATGAGIVVEASYHREYGNMIEIDHGNGLRTRYGHNQSLLVKPGELVTRGQVIARMGSTGRSTGNHLHYEVLRDGKQVNPLKYVYPRQG